MRAYHSVYYLKYSFLDQYTIYFGGFEFFIVCGTRTSGQSVFLYYGMLEILPSFTANGEAMGIDLVEFTPEYGPNCTRAFSVFWVNSFSLKGKVNRKIEYEPHLFGLIVI